MPNRACSTNRAPPPTQKHDVKVTKKRPEKEEHAANTDDVENVKANKLRMGNVDVEGHELYSAFKKKKMRLVNMNLINIRVRKGVSILK